MKRINQKTRKYKIKNKKGTVTKTTHKNSHRIPQQTKKSLIIKKTFQISNKYLKIKIQ